MTRLTPRMALLAVLFLLSSVAHAAEPATGAEAPPKPAIELGAPFCDYMILQRDMKVPVWGWSSPGAKVTVQFAGQKQTATAAEDGRWRVQLDPLKASFEPQEMSIQVSGVSVQGPETRNPKPETLILKNILVGEVWMCSGQSNMQWPAGSSIVGGKLIPEIMARVEAGEEKQPVLREGKVTDVFSSLYPTERATGQWSEDWNSFSAIAFAFAYDIAREVQVPVGIVNCAFSTTEIQAWVPREGFATGTDEYTKAMYRRILESDYRTAEHKAAWDAFAKAIIAWGDESRARVEKGLNPPPRPGVPGNMSGDRDATWMCNGKIMPMAPYAIRGAIWNQGYASQHEGIVYRNNLHSLVRGWRAVFNNPELPVYFHQFYVGRSGDDGLTLSNTAEMRFGTWLAHNEIPNAAMASQIDITGGVHYSNKRVPGQRLALHALKNQYGKEIESNGPMYKGYKVEGRRLIVEFDHAEGLQVGQSMTVRGGFADPVPSDKEVTLFYLADADLTWHRARMAINGERITLTADGVDTPRGVAYGWNGAGSLPSLYNGAMLPMTPFVVYDHKFVVSDQWDLDTIRMDIDVPFFTWPMKYFALAGETIDPRSYGLQHKHRALWLLSPQFENHAVIQAGVPTRLYGKAIPGSVVQIEFGTFSQALTMGDEQDEWEATVPAMEASAEPMQLHVTCTLDGELAHERKLVNIVVGDVWYVAACDIRVPRGAGVPSSGPAPLAAWEGGNPQLRMLTSGGRRAEPMPMRFKMNASGNPTSRFFSRWAPTTGLTQALAEKIHARTGKPVGVIVLDPGGGTIKEWTGFEHLSKITAWLPDHEQLSPRHAPDPNAYVTHAEAYVQNWREYWKKVQSDPTFHTGNMAGFPGATSVETRATTIYNQSICAFSPGNFTAILCLTGKDFVADDEGAGFGEQFAVMANSWKETFARGREVIDPYFIYAMPGKELAPKITAPKGIKGRSMAYAVQEWLAIGRGGNVGEGTGGEVLGGLIDAAVNAVYP